MSVRRPDLWKTCVLMLALAGAAMPAYADPIAITSGAFFLTRGSEGQFFVDADDLKVRAVIEDEDFDTYRPPASCFEPSCGADFTLSISDAVPRGETLL